MNIPFDLDYVQLWDEEQEYGDGINYGDYYQSRKSEVEWTRSCVRRREGELCCYGDTEGMRSVVTFRGEQGKTRVCVCALFQKNYSLDASQKIYLLKKLKFSEIQDAIVVFSWVTRTWGDIFPIREMNLLEPFFCQMACRRIGREFMFFINGLYVSILKTSKNAPLPHFFGCDLANQCMCKTLQNSQKIYTEKIKVLIN